MKKWLMFFVAALIIILSACNGGEESAPTNTADSDEFASPESNDLEQTEIEIVGVRDAQISSQQIIADKLGYFKEEGLIVTNTLIESGPDIAPMVAGGSAPISLQTNFMDIILASSGVGVKIVAPVAQIAGTQAVVAGPEANINSPKDFEGKTIGIPAGADVQIAINKMAEEYNVDLSKVEVANLAPSDALTALQSGNIDAMAAWEPFITKAVANGGKFLFSGTSYAIEGEALPVEWMSVHSTLQVTDDYLEENPNTIKAVIRALEKATNYINENREEAIKILAPELHLTEEEVAEIMNRNVYDMTVDETFTNQSNGSVVTDYLLETGNISSVPEKTDYIDLTLLKEVNPDLVKSEVAE
ncbi:ABC transporter substrate-binding protein [Lysinibacillus telephonicus]|uniref:ABC transporter substrate-binding protein n=1 Tax=Lysinibacillus telephonicus TaxID=1714840 RepID=A0A3S0HFQ9_9BACI|nr:ABC transporter substrate-binding protein [Lysinibacillus telephonicus]RTQ89252.1 ABC transporter substrate-binding protein [Lysinibacillus telephonicus]